VHYACSEYRTLLEGNGVTCSMSYKGDCWDNAVAESFFSSLSLSLSLSLERELLQRQRLYSHNRYLSPIDFERGFSQERNAA
jgi:putative transposase